MGGGGAHGANGVGVGGATAGGEMARVNRMANYSGSKKFDEDISQFYRCFAFEKVGDGSKKKSPGTGSSSSSSSSSGAAAGSAVTDLDCDALTTQLKAGLVAGGKTYPLKYF